MKKLTRETPLIAALVLAAFASANQAQAVPATSLVNTVSGLALLNFDTATPGVVGAPVLISGLTAGDSLVSLDYRPLDAVLIGFGYNSGTGTARVYSLSLTTGVASSINANILTLGVGLARVTADFNPTPNAIRVVTSAATSNNLRITTGGTGTLATDTDLNPINAGIRATAYSRNTAGGGTSGATTLYEIDGTNNALVSQGSVDFFTGSGTSPNTGSLTTVATLTGVAGSAIVGFDIFSAPGTAASSPGLAFVATGTAGTGTLFSLNLTTAAATSLGTIGGTYTSVVDVATVPEPTSLAMLAFAVAGFATRRFRSGRKVAVA